MSKDVTIVSEAKSLARNPLGIIALFIVLVYGFASLVVGAAADRLMPDERMLLILFLVLFPCIVLVVFFVLVTRHHWKLYAPSDYKADSGFLHTLGPERQRDRLEEQLAEDADEAPGSGAEVSPQSSNVPTENESASPGPPAPVAATAGPMRPARAKYLLAEELALRAIEAEFGGVARRQVAISAGGETREFDAVLEIPKSREIVPVEIRILTGSRERLDVVDDARDRAAFLQNLPGPAPKFVYAIVTENSPSFQEKLLVRFAMQRELGKLPNLEVKMFDLRQLERRFGLRAG